MLNIMNEIDLKKCKIMSKIKKIKELDEKQNDLKYIKGHWQ